MVAPSDTGLSAGIALDARQQTLISRWHGNEKSTCWFLVDISTRNQRQSTSFQRFHLFSTLIQRCCAAWDAVYLFMLSGFPNPCPSDNISQRLNVCWRNFSWSYTVSWRRKIDFFVERRVDEASICSLVDMNKRNSYRKSSIVSKTIYTVHVHVYMNYSVLTCQKYRTGHFAVWDLTFLLFLNFNEAWKRFYSPMAVRPMAGAGVGNKTPEIDKRGKKKGPDKV